MPRGDGEDAEEDARPAAEQAAPRGDGRDAAAVALVVAAEDASLEREDTAAAAAAAGCELLLLLLNAAAAIMYTSVSSIYILHICIYYVHTYIYIRCGACDLEECRVAAIPLPPQQPEVLDGRLLSSALLVA